MGRVLAPVAVFVYNRPDNTKKVMEALQQNYLARDTELFIFSDAPKNKYHAAAVSIVRNYIKTVSGFKAVCIIEREENYYIERNITEGVTEIINKYGKIIVLEDDGVTAKNFLTFMNDALDFYQNKKKVMHIAAFTFIAMPAEYKKVILWPYSENGGGWATWKDRWDKFVWFSKEEEILPLLSENEKNKLELGGVFKCLNALKLDPIPWDICWYIAIHLNNGLAVNSPRSLVQNIGLYNGTHFSSINRHLGKHPFEVTLSEDNNIIFDDDLKENEEAMRLLKNFYATLGKRKLNITLGYFVRGLVMRITEIINKISQEDVNGKL